MKTVIALSLAAVLAFSTQAYAGGSHGGSRGHSNGNYSSTVVSQPLLSPNIALSVGGIGLLNGNTVAVGNNSSILSGILNGNANGNSLLSGIGITGQTGPLSTLLQSQKKSW